MRSKQLNHRLLLLSMKLDIIIYFNYIYIKKIKIIHQDYHNLIKLSMLVILYFLRFIILIRLNLLHQSQMIFGL